MERKETRTVRNDKCIKRSAFAVVSILLTVIICLAIKQLIKDSMGVGETIEVIKNIFNLNYAQHFSDYLDFRLDKTAYARIVELVFLTSVYIFRDKKEVLQKIWITSLVVLGVMLVVITGGTNLISSYMIQTGLMGFFCVHTDFGKRLFKHKVARAMLLLYIGGGLANIIDQNLYGFVTDYIWVLPTTNRKCSNLEDWFNWIPRYSMFGYLLWYAGNEIIKGLCEKVKSCKRGKK